MSANKSTKNAQQTKEKTTTASTANNVFNTKNKILSDLTHAIQLVQKSFLDKEVDLLDFNLEIFTNIWNKFNYQGRQQEPMTNSDYQVHELCQQFDKMFLFGLKKAEEGYWKLAIEFAHKNVIIELKRLLNVTTCFGLGRAWVYHALNDNLMESYLRCFFENKPLILRYYRKEQALMVDEQAKIIPKNKNFQNLNIYKTLYKQVISVLVTLVAGLENVQFKLNSVKKF